MLDYILNDHACKNFLLIERQVARQRRAHSAPAPTRHKNARTGGNGTTTKNQGSSMEVSFFEVAFLETRGFRCENVR